MSRGGPRLPDLLGRPVARLHALAGRRPGIEPTGALTNGSFQQEFASRFSTEVRETRMLCLAGQALGPLLPAAGRLLVKMDVEGAEPEVLRSLEGPGGPIDQVRLRPHPGRDYLLVPR